MGGFPEDADAAIGLPGGEEEDRVAAAASEASLSAALCPADVVLITSGSLSVACLPAEVCECG